MQRALDTCRLSLPAVTYWVGRGTPDAAGNAKYLLINADQADTARCCGNRAPLLGDMVTAASSSFITLFRTYRRNKVCGFRALCVDSLRRS